MSVGQFTDNLHLPLYNETDTPSWQDTNEGFQKVEDFYSTWLEKSGISAKMHEVNTPMQAGRTFGGAFNEVAKWLDGATSTDATLIPSDLVVGSTLSVVFLNTSGSSYDTWVWRAGRIKHASGSTLYTFSTQTGYFNTNHTNFTSSNYYAASYGESGSVVKRTNITTNLSASSPTEETETTAWVTSNAVYDSAWQLYLIWFST